ncbi:MAG: FeoB-associated Cys-rich membrane protein [Oscillospiraceae bacterium]|nr:FeoB-associated Cys-rich membrane protein [Oscillospiraceae bacterium]
MLGFISENLGSLIIGAIILLVIVLIILKMVRGGTKSLCSCGDCSSCSSCGACDMKRTETNIVIKKIEDKNK